MTDLEANTRERQRLNRLALFFFAMSGPCIVVFVWIATRQQDPDLSQAERDVDFWGGLAMMGSVSTILLVGAVWCVVSARRVG